MEACAVPILVAVSSYEEEAEPPLGDPLSRFGKQICKNDLLLEEEIGGGLVDLGRIEAFLELRERKKLVAVQADGIDLPSIGDHMFELQIVFAKSGGEPIPRDIEAGRMYLGLQQDGGPDQSKLVASHSSRLVLDQIPWP